MVSAFLALAVRLHVDQLEVLDGAQLRPLRVGLSLYVLRDLSIGFGGQELPVEFAVNETL